MKLGVEQFRNAITEFRNIHIIAAMRPLMNFRTDLIANDEFRSRGGTDDPTRDHFLKHLLVCDVTRRHVTQNPDGDTDLQGKIAKAIDTKSELEIGTNPFGGDDIQGLSGSMVDLIWELDGTNSDIPLMSQLKDSFKQSVGVLILGALDRAIVNWTRLESRHRTRFITPEDSMRIYGEYQQIYGVIVSQLGTANRVDVLQVLPSEEPQGVKASPNLKGETASPSGSS